VRAQTPMQAVDGPQGGKIFYGQVNGATCPAAAMSSMLRVVHNNFGEKPQIGKTFRVRGSNSVAVFFSVANTPQGHKPVAGMVFASVTGPNQVEAAMVIDETSRFGSTVNPMLTKLFSVWHPGGAAAAGGGSAPAVALRPVTLPDNSASLNIPDRWQVKGTGGTAIVTGPNYETVGLNYTRLAVDPNSPALRQYQRYGTRPNNNGKIVYPSNVDLTRAFPDIFQQFWRINGANPTGLQLNYAQQVQGPPGQRCAHVTGHVNLTGAQGGNAELLALLCTTSPDPMGNYMVMLSMALVQPELADKERGTIGAILSSYQVNQGVVAGQAGAMAAPAIAAIHAIGAAAAQRAAAADRQHDMQNQAWEADQDNKARQVQGFSNYLLDQSVVQDNYRQTHETDWNQTAEALVKSDPNRYEIVDYPNYWKGWDF